MRTRSSGGGVARSFDLLGRQAFRAQKGNLVMFGRRGRGRMCEEAHCLRDSQILLAIAARCRRLHVAAHGLGCWLTRGRVSRTGDPLTLPGLGRRTVTAAGSHRA